MLRVLAVGSGIILFGWVIPTRVGLSKQSSVGLILILLGVLNLIGILLPVNELQGALRSHPSSRGDFLPTHSSGK